jgi:hypothetical protein
MAPSTFFARLDALAAQSGYQIRRHARMPKSPSMFIFDSTLRSTSASEKKVAALTPRLETGLPLA